MAYIKVDHSKFENAASEIDEYVSLLKDKMKTARLEVLAMTYQWQGSDAVEFMKQFDKIDDDESVYKNMIESLESYATFLRYAAKRYKDAQTVAVNRANALNRWI